MAGGRGGLTFFIPKVFIVLISYGIREKRGAKSYLVFHDLGRRRFHLRGIFLGRHVRALETWGRVVTVSEKLARHGAN